MVTSVSVSVSLSAHLKMLNGLPYAGFLKLHLYDLHKIIKNKAKAISAELLEFIFKNKLEEMGKTR